MPLIERYLNSNRLGWVGIGLFLVSAVTFLIGPLGDFPVPYRLDVDVYRTGAQVFLDGGSVYGSMPQLLQGGHLPFTYPPIAAALFTVFAVMPLWLGSTLLTASSIACLAVVFRIVLGQTCERPGVQLWRLIAAAMAIGLWLGPMRETLVVGQVNAVLMALVVVGAVCGRGKWWGGILIGLAIAIKLTPAVFLLLLVLRRDWRGATTTVASFLVFTGVGHLLMPRDSVQYWTQTLTDTARIGRPAFATNQSINAVVSRLGLDGSTRTMVWFVVSMVVGLLIAWVAGRLLSYGHDTAATITVGFAALFCSPVSWGHHWVWALPLMVLMLVWAARPETETKRWLWLVGIGTLVFLATPQWWFPNKNDVELQWNALQQIVGSAYLVWGLIAMVMIGWSAHRLGKPDKNVAGSITVLWPLLFRSPAYLSIPHSSQDRPAFP